MRPLIAAAALCGLARFITPWPAAADFVLLPPAPRGQSTSAESAGSNNDAATEPPKPHFAIAEGFGAQVPLSFAVRQIVPAPVKVHFGKGVDPETRVDWKGGRPWNAVLWSAVHSLGLHLYLRDGAAWITN